MGCGYDYICRTCKKGYNVGYGSYGTWFYAPRTVQEWQAEAAQRPREAELRKNQLVLQVLTEHEGHDIYIAFGDIHHVDRKSGALVSETGSYGADEVAIPNYADYEYIDLWEQR